MLQQVTERIIIIADPQLTPPETPKIPEGMSQDTLDLLDAILDKDQLDIYLLSYEGVSPSEIAERMDLPLLTVSRKLQEAHDEYNSCFLWFSSDDDYPYDEA